MTRVKTEKATWRLSVYNGSEVLYNTGYGSDPTGGIAAVQNLTGLELSGEGVLVGIIDTGINYLDPIFRNLDGSTRIRRIWDQEEQSGTAPREIGYGSEYTREQINLAIQSEN